MKNFALNWQRSKILKVFRFPSNYYHLLLFRGLALKGFAQAAARTTLRTFLKLI